MSFIISITAKADNDPSVNPFTLSRTWTMDTAYAPDLQGLAMDVKTDYIVAWPHPRLNKPSSSMIRIEVDVCEVPAESKPVA